MVREREIECVSTRSTYVKRAWIGAKVDERGHHATRPELAGKVQWALALLVSGGSFRLRTAEELHELE
jgi:hypothetical protein